MYKVLSNSSVCFIFYFPFPSVSVALQETIEGIERFRGERNLIAGRNCQHSLPGLENSDAVTVCLDTFYY